VRAARRLRTISSTMSNWRSCSAVIFMAVRRLLGLARVAPEDGRAALGVMTE
jgi:hypothetical protein